MSLLVPPGVLEQQDAGDFDLFDDLILALGPEMWFKFQDANFNAGTNLTDSSGNGRDIPRTGSQNIAAGAAFRNTTTKSADFASVDSRSSNWIDSSELSNGFVEGQSACSYLFSIRHLGTPTTIGKILGWMWSSTNSPDNVTTAWMTTSKQVVLQMVNSSGTIFNTTASNNDTDVHIYGVTFGSSLFKVYKDGALLNSQNIGTATIRTSASAVKLTIGGGIGVGGNINSIIDHFSLFSQTLSPTEMTDLMNAYLAELV